MIDNYEIHRVLFDVPLKQEEIKYFRGAIIENVLRNKPYFDKRGINTDLFHNHNEQKGDLTHTLTRFPLIQYTQFGNKAAIIAVDKGVEALKAYMEIIPGKIQYNDKWFRFGILDQYGNLNKVELSPDLHYYQLTNWLGLQEDHYLEWQNCNNFHQRITILENSLHGSVSRLLHALNQPAKNMEAPVLLDFIKSDFQVYKKFTLKTFELVFSTHYNLPGYICIGKGCSLGYGQLTKLSGKP